MTPTTKQINQAIKELEKCRKSGKLQNILKRADAAMIDERISSQYK